MRTMRWRFPSPLLVPFDSSADNDTTETTCYQDFFFLYSGVPIVLGIKRAWRATMRDAAHWWGRRGSVHHASRLRAPYCFASTSRRAPLRKEKKRGKREERRQAAGGDVHLTRLSNEPVKPVDRYIYIFM